MDSCGQVLIQRKEMQPPCQVLLSLKWTRIQQGPEVAKLNNRIQAKLSNDADMFFAFFQVFLYLKNSISLFVG